MPSTLKISIQSSSRAAIAIATAHRIYTIVVSYVGNVSVMLTLFCCFILFTAFNGWSMMFPPTPFEHQRHTNAHEKKKHTKRRYRITCIIALKVVFYTEKKTHTHSSIEKEGERIKNGRMIERTVCR